MFEEVLTKEVLENEYIKSGMSTAAIARKHKTCVKTVRDYMKLHGIKFRLQIKDLTNQRFGKLIALKLSNERDTFGKCRWDCKCDCGNIARINGASLVRGLTTSCGCYKLEIAHKGGYKDLSRSWWRRLVQSAMQRGFDFEITPEYIWKLFEEQNRQCILSGLPLTFFPDSNRKHLQTASVDRIDSNKGYIEGNIQILHKVVNQMKSFLSDYELISFCNLIAKRNPQSHEDSILGTTRTILRKIRSSS